MTIEEKESSLIALIDTLCDPSYSSSQANQAQTLDELIRVYSNNFRHSYSKIFYKLQSVFSQDFEISSALGENLNSLGAYIHQQIELHPDDANLQNADKGFRKLYDHINLEIGRYNFIKQQFAMQPQNSPANTPRDISPKLHSQISELAQQIKDQKSDLEKIKPVVTEAKSAVDKVDTKLESVDTKLESNKLSSITALTIFSAVTLSFSGGISFASSVFDNIGNVTPYRLVFIVSLVGFILFNTIFALLYIISKMTGKPISARCKYLSTNQKNPNACRSCGDGYCMKQCSAVSLSCKIWHKYSYVFAINIILLLVMYYDYLTWSLLPKRTFLSYSCSERFLFAVPFVAFLIFLVIQQINKINQRHRIFLSVKCDAVSQYFSPSTPSTALLMSIAAIANKLFGQQKNYAEELANIIKEDSPERMKKIDIFVEDKLLTTEVLAQTITGRQHKRNKRQWETLSKQINEVHSDNTPDTAAIPPQ